MTTTPTTQMIPINGTRAVLNPGPNMAEPVGNGNLTMSLKEIGLDASIRYVQTEDSVMFSQIDVVKAVTGKDNNHAAEIIRKLSDEVTKEVNVKNVTFKFKGRGQQNTTLITFQGVLKLVMALPGENAKAIRVQFCQLLHRYFAGDVTLVGEILQNAEAPGEINQMAQETLAAEMGDQLPQVDYAELVRQAIVTLEEKYKQDLVVFKQEVMQNMKKTDKQVRRLHLSDETRTQKRKLHEITHVSETNIKERKAILDLEVKAEVAKSEAEIKKHREAKQATEAQIELVKLQLQIQNQSQTQTQPCTVPEATSTVQSITVREVALKRNLLANLGDSTNLVLGQAGKMVKKAPYNLIPYDTFCHEKDSFGIVYEVHRYPIEKEDIIAQALTQTIKDLQKKTAGTAQPVNSNMRSIDSFFSNRTVNNIATDMPSDIPSATPVVSEQSMPKVTVQISY